ncbi:uncharacterized protein LOC143242235 [Tachypleus tridentatus]|uniref:uncharacterized protein LOC143242235 n=1 Tax=Tachypleus tridentatus TaxID=6853 RepID=UPI003FD649D4
MQLRTECPAEFDNDLLLAIHEKDCAVTVVHPSIVHQHLQLGRVLKFGKWVPHELCLQNINSLLFSPVYVPAENLNCTRGYQRDVYRCYPCPPGHYDNGFQTHCLPCPGGTYMTSFAADACIPCPGDKITDEEGADNKDLCRSNGTKGF